LYAEAAGKQDWKRRIAQEGQRRGAENRSAGKQKKPKVVLHKNNIVKHYNICLFKLIKKQV